MNDYQYIGKIIIQGHDEFQSINPGDRLKLIFKSDNNPIAPLGNDMLKTFQLDPRIKDVKRCV